MYEKKLANIYYKCLLDNRSGFEYKLTIHLNRFKIKKLFREIIENDNYYLVSSGFIKYLSSLKSSNQRDLIESLAYNKNITLAMMKYVYCYLGKQTYKFMNLNEVESRAAEQYNASLYKLRYIYNNADQDLIWDILLAITANYIISKGTDDSITRTMVSYIEDSSGIIDELMINGIIRLARMNDGSCHKSKFFFDEGKLASYILSKKEEYKKVIR